VNTQAIKGYELHERIGTGGFGAVYRASQTTIGREVAVKIVLPTLANQPEFIRRFESEAQVVARLEHPHIVPLHDYWRDADGAYLVMRWLKGGSLRDALQNGPFDLRSAALMLDQISAALSLAHRSGIIHRDLKPGNILLDEDGNAYLSDFGIAKDLNLSHSHTQADTIVGSLDYISPEQARSEAITPRTDIYSLGVTLYEVISGHHPFEGFSSVERLYKHINDPMPEITTLDAALAVAVNTVLQKATSKDPQYRYSEVLAFAADFREAAGLNRTPTTVVKLLTQREQDILHLIIEGLSNKEIAQRLTVTLGTVKWYVNQIYAKLGVRSRVQAMVRARELNLLTTLPDTADISVVTTDFNPENPYKGLHAFSAADYKNYFGREKLTDKLIKKLNETTEFTRFLAVVGPSGSGKSSLVKAGLIPAIWKGALSGSEKWFVAEMLPGVRPLDELEVTLTKIAANHADRIREHLTRDKYGLSRVASMILPNDGSDLLLVIDQFEEIFTLVEDEQAREHFLDLIYTAVTTPRSRVRVVVTLRADFYDRPLHYPKFGELVRTRMETIMPLSADELERAIVKPAEQIGAKFEAGLVTTIVSEVKYQAGALPLLQYALTELFERRSGKTFTLEAYQAIGGTVGALAKRAEEIYADLDETGKEMARQMFLRLVTLGEGTEDTRRRVMRSELLAIATDADVMDEVIDAYAEYRLLSLDNDPATRTPTVEVAHEAILREWERLREWLNESRDDVRLQRQLLALADEWHTAKQDASFLLRGSRLETFEKWVKNVRLALTAKERTFLNASLIQRTKEQTNEANRQAHELKLAQNTAKAERRAASGLRALVAVLVLAMLSAFGLTGVALNQSNEAQNARATSDMNAEVSQSLALAAGSQLALSEGNTDLALALAAAANRGTTPPALAQQALFNAAFAPGTRQLLVGHSNYVSSVDISADGRYAVSASCPCNQIIATSEVIIWDLEHGVELRRINNDLGVISGVVAMSPDARYLLIGVDFEGACGRLSLWEVETGERIRCFDGHTGIVSGVDFSADGRTAVSGSEDGDAILWDVQTGAEIRRFHHGAWVNSPRFSPDGTQLLTGADDNAVWLWDVQTGELIRRFTGHSMWVSSVEWSPDGRTVLSGAYEGDEIYLWDTESGELIRTFDAFSSTLRKMDISSNGLYAAVGYGNSVLLIYEIATGTIVERLYGHSAAVNSVVYNADGQLLSGSYDQTVRLWDVENSAVVQRFSGVHSTAAEAVFSSDNTRIFSVDANGLMAFWDVATGQPLHLIEHSFQGLEKLSFSLDGTQALITEYGGGVSVWDVETGALFRDVGETYTLASFSPDGRTILVGSIASLSLTLIDLASGDTLQQFSGHQNGLFDATFSPNGRMALSGSWDSTARLWDVATGEELHRFEHPSFVKTVAFSPDGRFILTGCGDGIVRLWDVETGEELRRFVGHTTFVSKVIFSPDGQLAASSSNDNSILLWEVATGAILRRLPAVGGFTIYNLSFTADGQFLLTGSGTGDVLLWNLGLDLPTLLTWTHTNRYVPELDCTMRELYRVAPLCVASTSP
jgi:WD40 repeat protein/serine/threonine protein kinase